MMRLPERPNAVRLRRTQTVTRTFAQRVHGVVLARTRSETLRAIRSLRCLRDDADAAPWYDTRDAMIVRQKWCGAYAEMHEF